MEKKRYKFSSFSCPFHLRKTVFL
ncbi:MAG: hypothetical protein RL710_2523, partial [Pseudomonadota bacterium]